MLICNVAGQQLFDVSKFVKVSHIFFTVAVSLLNLIENQTLKQFAELKCSKFIYLYTEVTFCNFFCSYISVNALQKVTKHTRVYKNLIKNCTNH